MNIDEAIYTYLSTDTTFAAFFSDVTEQIAYGDDQFFKKKPKCVFELVSSPGQWNKPQKWQRWRFNITSTSIASCDEIKSRALYLLEHGSGDMGTLNIGNTQFIDGGQSPRYYQDISAYKTFFDIRFSYNL